jgi:biopolymer transport protein ExbD
MERRVTSHSVPNAEPNVTPMIDVLLVMLIVFMMAVVEVRRTVGVQLPQRCDGACVGTDAVILRGR